MRQSGVLMPVSSLPGPDGIGSLGKEAFAFADFLHDSGMRIWQVLPMGPVGYGESPYQSASVFAGNPLLISLQTLHEEGLLNRMDDDLWEEGDPERVDYPAVRRHKELLLRRCFMQSESRLRHEVADFVAENRWVKDFAMFTAVKEHFSGRMWTQWPDEDIRFHRKKGLEHYREELGEDLRYHIFCQYLFFRQWNALREYCHSLDIQLFGDMPIYVAEDSADTWTHPEVFQLDRDRVPKRVAGVPPDYFSADGQLWGNPLYRWHRLRWHNYDWWVDRMRQMARMYDILRIDHFIGFANYYSVKYGAPNAREGKWVVGPGKSLFDTLNREVPGVRIVAEDLGCVNDRVRALLDYVGYPGMRVLEFAFGADDSNQHLPANYPENCVAYTATHDNNTVRGWVENARPEHVEEARALLGFETAEEAPEAFIRAVLACRAETAVIPMQDVLGLGEEACMNRPGTIGGNWRWRMKPGAADASEAARLRAMNEETGRLPQDS